MKIKLEMCQKCQQVVVTRINTAKQLPPSMLAGLEKLRWRYQTGKVWRWQGWDHMYMLRTMGHAR